MTSEEYQRTAKALARETVMNAASAERIERELLERMASTEAANRRSPKQLPSLPPLAGKAWLAIAATILLVAGAPFVWHMNRPVTVPGMPFVGPRDVRPNPSAAEVFHEPIDHLAVLPSTLPAAPRSHRIRRPPQKAATVINPSGFVELPWTADLPAFESGEIVRMAVPVASLPAYGIDISSGADRPVEADILIGQDGLARAIRLVTNSARSTQ